MPTYKTARGAKMAANKAYSPCVVRLMDGTYDWFPAGHPLPKGSKKIAVYRINRWIDVSNKS